MRHMVYSHIRQGQILRRGYRFKTNILELNSEINEMVMVHMLVGKLPTYPDRIKTSIFYIKESEKNPSFLFIIFSTIT